MDNDITVDDWQGRWYDDVCNVYYLSASIQLQKICSCPAKKRELFSSDHFSHFFGIRELSGQQSRPKTEEAPQEAKCGVISLSYVYCLFLLCAFTFNSLCFANADHQIPVNGPKIFFEMGWFKTFTKRRWIQSVHSNNCQLLIFDNLIQYSKQSNIWY